MFDMSTVLFRGALSGVLIGMLSGIAVGQTYPVKPIRLVVTYPAGGSSDIMARVLGAKLTESLGQQIVIESKPGASGSIGTEFAARQAPDGYTFVIGNLQPVAVNPLLSKVPYDSLKDFAPVSLIATGPNILVVPASSPHRSLRDLIADARAKKGTYNFGTSGPGSMSHLAGELLKRAADIDMVAIQYKGSALLTQDLLAGNVQLAVSDALPVMPHIKSGKLRALAITSEKRSEMTPDIPTFAEGGVNGLAAVSWWGVLFPAGTPKPILDRMHAELVKALSSPDLKQRYADLGVTAVSSSPEEFRSYIQSEMDRWGKLIREAGIKAE
jgi:tripartite-type tricarboxylate transporter receptor subunit TctC